MKKSLHKRVSNRGVALFLTLVALAIISILGFGLVTVTTAHSKTSVNYENSNKAYYLARTGIARAMDELKYNYWWGTSSTHVLEDDGGTTTLNIWAPASNFDNVRKVWKVTSTGEYNGARRTLTAWLELESFAIYCYFSDRELMGSTQLWFTGSDSLNGPVHTNAFFNIYRNPSFTHRVTSANQTDSNYYETPNRRYRQGNQWYTDFSKFYRYYSNYNLDQPVGTGGFFFAGGQPDIPLPPDASDIETLAEKNYDRDIYIKFLEDGYAEVWYKIGSNWQVEQVDTSYVTIHTTKDVYFYTASVVNGQVTVASDGNMFIQDSITYKDIHSDVLGMVAGNNIRVDTNIHTNKDLTIHATMMALDGSFGVDKYNQGSYRGHLTVYGGIIQNQRYAIGTFNSSTGQTQTGYSRTYEYDTKLANSPPPNYPTTGKLKLISLEDSSALGSTIN